MNGGILAPLNLHRIERPHALKIPVRRAEYPLTENVALLFQVAQKRADGWTNLASPKMANGFPLSRQARWVAFKSTEKIYKIYLLKS
jgi:hypothetical protein